MRSLHSVGYVRQPLYVRSSCALGLNKRRWTTSTVQRGLAVILPTSILEQVNVQANYYSCGERISGT